MEQQESFNRVFIAWSAFTTTAESPSKRKIVQFNLAIVNYTINRRNRRAMTHRSHLALIPLEKLFAGRDDAPVYTLRSSSGYG